MRFLSGSVKRLDDLVRLNSIRYASFCYAQFRRRLLHIFDNQQAFGQFCYYYYPSVLPVSPLLTPPYQFYSLCCNASRTTGLPHIDEISTVSSTSGFTRRSHDLEPDDRAKKDHSYQRSADAVLQSFHDQLDQLEFADIIDAVDLKEGGVLEISLSNSKGTIVVNKHYVHRQLWYSSPNSGADYFDFQATPRWFSHRCDVTINERLSKDLQAISGCDSIQIDLPSCEA